MNIPEIKAVINVALAGIRQHVSRRSQNTPVCGIVLVSPHANHGESCQLTIGMPIAAPAR